MHEFRVIPKLRIYDFYIFGVPFDKQILHVVEASLDVGAKLADCNALTSANFATHFICHDQNWNIKIITTLSNAIGNLIDLADLSKEFITEIVVVFIWGSVEDAASKSLLALVTTHLLDNTDRFCNMPPSISFDRHEFSDISTLIYRPILIELFQQSLNLGPMTQKILSIQLAEVFRHSCFGCYNG